MRETLHTAVLFLVCLLPFGGLVGQKEIEKMSATILQKDSLFWTVYNTCATDRYKEFFSEDVEFYHDKGGMMHGLDSLVASAKRNLCGINNFRLRREAVEGSVKVFPLQKSGVIYGAILSGEHVFYILEKGKEPKLDGLAKFTHLWLLQNGEWKMTRILSYDHGPAGGINTKKEISLAPEILKIYEGNYTGPQTGAMTIRAENGLLILAIKDKSFSLHPEAQHRFFITERNLDFEFKVKNSNQVSSMIVRENGSVVEEAMFTSKN